MATALPFGIGTPAPSPSGSTPLPFGIKPMAASTASPAPTPANPTPSPASPKTSVTGSEIKAAPLPNYIPFWDTDMSKQAKPVEDLPWYLQPGRELSDTLRGAISAVADQATKTSYSIMGLTGKTNPDGTMQKDITPSDHQAVVRASNIVSTGLAGLNVALSPISGAMKGAERIPGIGLAAKLVNTVFSDVGHVGAVAADDIVHALPISQENKDAIRQPIEDMFALLGQVALGKVAHDVAAPKLDEYNKQIHDTATKLSVTSETPGETKVNITTPEKTAVPVASQTPGEHPVNVTTPYTPHDQLPVIDFGKPAGKAPIASPDGEVVPLPNSEQSTKTYQQLISESKQRQPTAPTTDNFKVTPDIQDKLDEAYKQSKGIPETHTISTPERLQMRQEIADNLYGDGARNRNKRADIVMGYPAAGKSSALVDPLASRHGSLVVDSDMAKAQLPEYLGGIGAGAVHEESSFITENGVFNRAIKNGDNIVMPLVGKSLPKMYDLIDTLHKEGYDVNLHYNDLPIEKARNRAIQRYLDTGRYVNPEYIDNLGLRPSENYDTLKTYEKVKSYAKYSNDVPKGESPKLQEARVNVAGRPRQEVEVAKAEPARGDRQAVEAVKPKPIEGTGETKTRGLSAGVEAKAIENKLTQGFKGLPEYQKMDVADQAKKAAELINSDYARAKRVALGSEPSPQGLHPEAVFTGVEARATAEGDVATLRDLATRSSLTTEATTMGQRIKLLDERNPDSPVKAIRDVSKAREVAAEKRVKDISSEKRGIVSDIGREIKAVPKKQSWVEFVRTIQC